MKHHLIAAIVFCCILASALASAAAPPQEKKQRQQPTPTPPPTPGIFSAFFGSCNKHDQDQSFWPRILDVALANQSDFLAKHKEHPAIRKLVEGRTKKNAPPLLDAGVMLGDNVYLDDMMPGMLLPIFFSHDLAEHKRRWDAQRNNKFYSDFVANTRHMTAVLDDHDYYRNDIGKENPYRDEAQQFLLDFIDLPKVSSKSKSASASSLEVKVRREERKGVYSFSRVPFATATAASSTNSKSQAKNVCFILLDVRYHRDAPRADDATHGGISSSGDVLGEEQSRWLDAVLATGRDPDFETDDDSSKNPNPVKSIDDVCAVTFIGSGVQILADGPPSENWGEFRGARDRLLRALLRSGARRFVFLSGDVHFGSFDVLRAKPVVDAEADTTAAGAHIEPKTYNKCGESPFAAVGQDLWEATSSGLTHSFIKLVNNDRMRRWFPSHRKYGEPFLQKNFGTIQVRCDDIERAESCRTFIGVHSIETGKVVLEIEPTFVFGDDDTEATRRQVASERDRLGCPPLGADNFSLLLYPNALTRWVMAIKRYHAWLFGEEHRIVVVYVIAWGIALGALSVVVLALLLVRELLRMCFSAAKKKID